VLVTAPGLLTGVALDLALGDPQWMPHPVRGIGWLARVLEGPLRATGLPLRLAGLLFWILVVGSTAAAVWVTVRPGYVWCSVYWIWSLLACRDLDVESGRVIRALSGNDLPEARKWLSWIVGRDTATLDEPEVIRATIETVAENLGDGVIAPLFWLAIGGPVGMAAYKAVNTLDSMVGYRNERYCEFGWASARMDDLANFIPARLAAVLVWIAALLPGFDAQRAVRVTLRDGGSQPSPNSGYPEAAVAGAMGVQLGGVNYYQGKPSLKATLGDAVRPLERGVFGRVRVLLYASEGLCVAAILGCVLWL
jgi:adenosylcobinamide-phosphate synthase